MRQRKGLSWMKRFSGIIFFLLILISMFSFSHYSVLAESSDEIIIEDTQNYLTNTEKEYIEDEVKKLPENYKIIILPSIHGELDEMSKALFLHRNLSQDTILILVVTEDKKITAVTGEALQNKGLNKNFFSQEIANYFVPSELQQGLSVGIVQLTQGISKDIPKFLVKEKNSLTIPAKPENDTNSEHDQMFWERNKMVLFLTGILIFLFAWWILYSRRKKKISL